MFNFLKRGLKKTKNGFFGRAISMLKGGITPEKLDEIQELLLLSDVGPETSEYIIEKMRKGKGDPEEVLRNILTELLGTDERLNFSQHSPTVYTLVGVNGSGKTTTAGKLAWRFKKDGKRVLLAAADTFRAAAIEQLKEWGKRADVPVIAHQMGADGGAVAYDAVRHAISNGLDLVIVDTAGRLHTKDNLMRELEKIHKVIKKLLNDQPTETLLVLDATIGQNAIQQARVFDESVKLTGIALTKLDGTAKGGMIFSIRKELGIPVKLIGIGESMEDLKDFNSSEFVNTLLE